MSVTPEPFASAATGEGAGEPASRPKFSRRPASFSRPPSEDGPVAVPAASEKLPVPVPAAAAASTTPHGTPWQEDARFGIALLIVVVIINTALVWGLPLLPDHTVRSGPTQVTAKAPTMPDAIGREEGHVTLYSQPEEERRTIYLLDLRNTSEQNTLSVSPYDIPAPRARAIERTPDNSDSE